MTNIGDIIGPGDAIPADVTELADQQTGEDGWSRWVRHGVRDLWEWWRDPEPASAWRAQEPPRGGSRSSAGLVKQGQEQDWAPFRVLAVREPEPAEHPVLDLVGQYGAAQCTAGYQMASLDRGPARSATAEAEELFVRIEAALTGPVTTLTMPVAPPGAVALIGSRNGQRYERRVVNGRERWSRGDAALSIGTVMAFEGTVTVVYPPPEPTLAEDIETVRDALETSDAAAALRRIEAALAKDGAA